MKDELSPDLTPGQRAAAYWFVDGLPELVFGLVFLLIGIVPFAVAWLHLRSPKPVLVSLLMVFLILFIWDRRILGWFKARVTYPRTGYVHPPADPTAPPQDFTCLTDPSLPHDNENVTWFRNRTVLAIFTGFNFFQLFPGPWAPSIIIVATAAVLYALNRRLEHPYSLWSVALLAAAGLVVHWLPFPPEARQFLPLLTGGGWLFIRGLWTLVRYLRANPLAHASGELVSE
jgi:hypothetical protein